MAKADPGDVTKAMAAANRCGVFPALGALVSWPDAGRDPIAGSVGASRASWRRPGFTLVELLVVLVILGLLATVAAPQAMRYLAGARHGAATLQLQGLATAIDLYRLDVGRYPEVLLALVQRPPGQERWAGPYVRKAEQLQDPWGRSWRYRSPGEHGAYDLFSLGADDQSGGAAENRDVTSW